MSFLDIPDENALPEQAPVTAGEHELCIVATERRQGTSKDGAPYDSISITLQATDSPDSKMIYHTLWLPKDDDTNERKNQSLRKIRYFLQAFNLPLQVDLDNLDSWVGNNGFGIVSIEQDEEYGDKNKVKRFVVPK